MEEQRALITRAQAGDRAAEEKVIRMHVPFVKKLIPSFAHGSYDADMALCDGMIGLMRAVRTFDVARDETFLTWARHHVLNEMRQGCRNHVREGERRTPHCSLDEIKPEEWCVDPVDSEAALDAQWAKESLMGAVHERLSDMERRTILHYYGMEGREERTLEDIARGLGLTRERIRQVRNSGLKKLKRTRAARKAWARYQEYEVAP